jgi:DNA-binding LytR/AlgR family response regulator
MTRARCDVHVNAIERSEVSRCATCRRIAIEQRIVKRVVDALLANGYALRVDDGEDYRPFKPTTDRRAILAELAATDDDTLETVKVIEGQTKRSFVRFVYGNDGYDVIADYGMSLDYLLEPITEYASTLETL